MSFLRHLAAFCGFIVLMMLAGFMVMLIMINPGWTVASTFLCIGAFLCCLEITFVLDHGFPPRPNMDDIIDAALVSAAMQVPKQEPNPALLAELTRLRDFIKIVNASLPEVCPHCNQKILTPFEPSPMEWRAGGPPPHVGWWLRKGVLSWYSGSMQDLVPSQPLQAVHPRFWCCERQVVDLDKLDAIAQDDARKAAAKAKKAKKEE